MIDGETVLMATVTNFIHLYLFFNVLIKFKFNVLQARMSKHNALVQKGIYASKYFYSFSKSFRSVIPVEMKVFFFFAP